MKAVVYTRYGDPDVLHLTDVPAPLPGEREILIRVRAAEATKSDCELRAFRFSVKWFWLPLRIAVGIRRPRRHILGGYFAGEVVSVGGRVTRFAAGDPVYGSAGLGLGGYGEYVVVPESAAIVPKPRNMTFAEAAAVPLGGLNALHFMRRAGIAPGERVLINGAGGSIGLHAVQIARSMGAHVTAVDHAIKEELLRRLGADDFVDYTSVDVTSTGRRFDVVFDMVAGSSHRRLLGMLDPGGRYLSGNPRLSVLLRGLTSRSVIVTFAPESREDLADLAEMIEAGAVRPIVDRVYPMAEAAEAHRRVETEQRLGAIVIAIGDPE
ncbi:alcohol dehydrogenase [Actinoplanes lobatus]|uniref:Alcohol dehydrogenase n=1 Tax=Actinoplanes lobatus TaxID=113568 RepID=A0A7W7MKM4_9ACTN|nr:NAD(P)-dependent alcohol dehydrogenase [Actinoplanes lobatus]MBB4753511.1 NADPH:quinone reductase-like Zn-dependent oxidoreductase [Actinoplanes lobatus]GGN91741.1 alcohol dehydrogenase [Actinoplanes lobatus]GIE38044.1 alcohol dehydrogenase [Actinoplanes lobatus]